MARVDYDALMVDLRDRLIERASWGRPQLLSLLAELEAKHRLDESADQAVLRRFSAHLTDTFLGVVPPPPSTGDPLVDADPPDGAGDGRAARPPDDLGGHDGRITRSTEDRREAGRGLAEVRP